jgi:hypothetical protein
MGSREEDRPRSAAGTIVKRRAVCNFPETAAKPLAGLGNCPGGWSQSPGLSADRQRRGVAYSKTIVAMPRTGEDMLENQARLEQPGGAG